jgi:hypothetical protein
MLTSPGRIESLSCSFLERDYVVLTDFLTDYSLRTLQIDVEQALRFARRRDFLMECMDNSPRRMNVINSKVLEENSKYVPALYGNYDLVNFLSRLTKMPVEVLETDIDRFVVNHLSKEGDTFGAHFDDYPISLAIVLYAPLPEFGGVPEIKPRAAKLADLFDNPITVPLKNGDAYVLRSDTAAHRVSPLKADLSRTAINFAYTWRGYSKKETVSAQRLYEDD